MLIEGLNKTTLLDYPKHIAATIFTPGCNMRCPFCHNADIVEGNLELINEEDVLEFLEKRKNILQGICITGGEPTLQKDLAAFIQKVKNMGYLIKLDTNGTNPHILKQLYTLGLLDYVAMDIKNTFEKYTITAGTENLQPDLIKESIFLIQNSQIPYEFRTTVVDEFHTEEDIRSICREINGACVYYLQSYVESKHILSGKSFHPWEPKRLIHLVHELQKENIHIETRGVDTDTP